MKRTERGDKGKGRAFETNVNLTFFCLSIWMNLVHDLFFYFFLGGGKEKAKYKDE